MDPQQTWTDMLDALKCKRWDDAKEAADELYEWVRKRGFPPTTVGDESLGVEWHRTIASFVCLIVANKVDTLKKRAATKEARKRGGK